MTYLADTSAVWRLLRKQVGDPWPQRVSQGLVSLCPPVESELMPALRADRDHEPFFTMLGQTFGWVPTPEDPWPKIIDVQRELVRIGHHRGPSPMDILIALTARQHRLTLIHVDDDFGSIAKVCPDIAMTRLQPLDSRAQNG
ncbi:MULTISPECIES: PIN domain nuclease [unclassified Streptomyces]|uniref:PIN domain nuclease n=1 Tax=unclassified Streptomyces TaxID=2593676 RepID=UPI002ED03B77|nr:PIN domain nuclease [Streptomyces sp. NBC_00891]WSY05549.1 PIN domain nuclease [Streptomyces sp. NBC_00890]WSZ07173.1 PIN domain nuclease [Streptomyces sp. NBC_00869]WSZ25328.1 PIN domain nuclease [Streptomyces sp. NBC_00870]